MDPISLEFNIKLKQVCHPSRIRTDEKFAKVPNIRKYLLLAYQIDRLIEANPDISLAKIAGWLGMSRTRVRQIACFVFLCPKIQEEILLGSVDKLNLITERGIRPVTKEIDWQKQISLWHSLS